MPPKKKPMAPKKNTTVVSPETTEKLPPQNSHSPKSPENTTTEVLESLKSSGGLVEPSPSAANLKTLQELNGGSNETTTTADGAVKSNGGGASNGGSDETAAGAVKPKVQPVGTFAASDPSSEARKFARSLQLLRKLGPAIDRACTIASFPLGIYGVYVATRAFEWEKMEAKTKKAAEEVIESKVGPVLESIVNSGNQLLTKLDDIQKTQNELKSKLEAISPNKRQK